MRRFSVFALLAVLAAVLTSCSRIPTAPSTDAQLDRGSANQAIGQVDDNPPPIQGQGGIVKSITLPVGVGGTLTAGRFTLVIHKNSLKMGATLTVIQPDPDVMQVEFEVTPAAANDFQVPVQLVADCSNDPLAHVEQETLYWWDGQWQEASSVSLDHATRSLTAHAHHLSNGKVSLRGQESTKHASN